MEEGQVDMIMGTCPKCGGDLQETRQSTEVQINEQKKVKMPELSALKCISCSDVYFTPSANQEMERILMREILNTEIDELEKECRSCNSQERYEELLIEIENLRKQLEDIIENSL
ncbi:hypothetical protein [Paenibacillus sp. AGC30]